MKMIQTPQPHRLDNRYAFNRIFFEMPATGFNATITTEREGKRSCEQKIPKQVQAYSNGN